MCNQFIYPAAYRPHWIMAAAGFSRFSGTWPDPVFNRHSSASHAAPAVIVGLLVPLLPKPPTKEKEREESAPRKGQEIAAYSRGVGPSPYRPPPLGPPPPKRKKKNLAPHDSRNCESKSLACEPFSLVPTGVGVATANGVKGHNEILYYHSIYLSGWFCPLSP